MLCMIKSMLFSRFWKISRNCLAASNIPSNDAWELTQFWVFCDEPPVGKGDSVRRCEYCAKMLFFVLFEQQVPPGAGLIPLGATDFYGLRSFRKTTFPDLLIVRFRWNFDRRFITCCYSLWTVEIRIGRLKLEIYVTHGWFF